MADYIARYSQTINDMVLSQSEMQTNARYIYNYLRSKYGWTIQATAGLLANAEAESTINPARPQNNAMRNRWWPSCPGYTGDAPVPTQTHYGFGLFQITPYMALSTTSSKYNPHTMGNWLYARGYTASWATGGTMGQMDPQLDWFCSGEPEAPFYNTADPTHSQAKWYDNKNNSPLRAATIAIYSKLTDSPEDCAATFYWNFERSEAQGTGNRTTLGRKWYNFLSGEDPGPDPPDPPDPPEPIRKSTLIWGGKHVWRKLPQLRR